MGKNIFIFICFCSTLFANSEQLIIGTASGYAPFVSITPEGEYEGFDVDVAKILAEKQNKKLVLKDLGSMSSLMLALKQKKVDAILWAISITEERRKEINLIHYQGATEKETPVLFWKKIPKGVEKIQDLAGISKKPISIEAGTSQEGIVHNFPNLKIKFVDKIADAIMDVKYKKSFAVMVDPSLVSTLRAQTPELQVKYLTLPEDLHVYGIGIGVTKDNPKLTAELESVVEDLKKGGVIEELERKWNLDS